VDQLMEPWIEAYRHVYDAHTTPPEVAYRTVPSGGARRGVTWDGHVGVGVMRR